MDVSLTQENGVGAQPTHVSIQEIRWQKYTIHPIPTDNLHAIDSNEIWILRIEGLANTRQGYGDRQS